MKLEFSRHIFKKFSCLEFHENPCSGIRVVPCGQTGMTKLIVTFRNLANAPKITVKPGRPQMTKRPMPIACWVTKATGTYTEYVIIIAFPRQQWLYERTLMLRYTYIACLVCIVFSVCWICWARRSSLDFIPASDKLKFHKLFFACYWFDRRVCVLRFCLLHRFCSHFFFEERFLYSCILPLLAFFKNLYRKMTE